MAAAHAAPSPHMRENPFSIAIDSQGCGARLRMRKTLQRRLVECYKCGRQDFV